MPGSFAAVSDLMAAARIQSVLVVLLSISFGAVYSAKRRAWLGPNTFYEGVLPSARAGHGFSCPNDGTIFMFGGTGTGAQSFKVRDCEKGCFNKNVQESNENLYHPFKRIWSF